MVKEYARPKKSDFKLSIFSLSTLLRGTREYMIHNIIAIPPSGNHSDLSEARVTVSNASHWSSNHTALTVT